MPAKAALSDGNQVARSMGLKTKLEDDWAKRCGIIRHCDQPPIKFEKARLAEMYSQSPCQKKGLCHCKNSPKPLRRRATHAVCCEQRVASIMRKQFWSRKKDGVVEKAPGRVCLEQGSLVLCFAGTQPSNPSCNPTYNFYHIGYLNFKTFEMATLKLCTDMLDWHLACDTTTSLVQLQVPHDEDPFNTMVDALHQEVDFLLKQDMFFLQIECSEQEQVATPNMVPGKIKARFFHGFEQTVIWHGAKQERRAQKAARKKARQQRVRQQQAPKPAAAKPKASTKYDLQHVPELGIHLVQHADPPQRRPRARAEPDSSDSSSSSSSREELAQVPDVLDSADGDWTEPKLAAIQDVSESSEPGSQDETDDVALSGEERDSEDEFFAGLDLQQEDVEAAQPAAPPAPADVDEEAASAEMQPAAAPASQDALAAAGLSFARRPGTCEVRFAFPDGEFPGELRYNVTSDFYRAHCPFHVDCARRRAAYASASDRGGQGRPLGLLLEWLHKGSSCGTREEHMALKAGSHEDRAVMRELFMRVPGAGSFASHERQQRAGEPDEPSKIA